MTGLSGRNSSVRRGASAYRGETLAEARPCRVPLSPDPWPAPSHSYSHCPSSDSVAPLWVFFQPPGVPFVPVPYEFPSWVQISVSHLLAVGPRTGPNSFP